MKKTIITIKGMHCASCADLIKMDLGDKIETINVNLEKGEAIVKFDEKTISEEDIRDRITKLGYRVQ